ncbi:NAD(P)H-dependent oxidoreductase [Actinoplanes sp. TBRC 11911]|uniref:NAD(P)H-dependent oxidoreductase n=1 Tax=Actinoplanes sp. TBRC 11911 TaxID=2729386 RepID=UPI00145F5AC7|nr:NAD(P)H-dependent oxidoreductase [Actinoplanes sp. TBRC 11911]NMO51079.1 NAD(P)H-dependent oxidoreductase [Actinoplanes sp. TBRC 11911]
MTRILLVSGSTYEASVQSAALRTAARIAPPDIAVTLFDGLRDLPAFVPGERTTPSAIALLRLQVNAADAILFSTPEYAGSLPGSLKNMIEWLVAGGELAGKPVAWLSVMAPGHDENACATLEAAVGHGNARLLTACCVRVPVEPSSVDTDGLVSDERLHQALGDVLHSIGRALTAAEQPKHEQPNWQTYSSVLPVIQRRQPGFGPSGRAS